MANAKERVKDFPSVVGTIQSDDYIPVDGATQGTRKATVDNIMEATISGLETTATNMKAALNEVATTAGKVWVGTQDEYDALPDSKLTDNVLHCITDGSPTQYEAVWNKVGTSQLQTTANNCSDGINELKSNLFKYTKVDLTTDQYGQTTYSPHANQTIISIRVCADRRFATTNAVTTTTVADAYIRITDSSGNIVPNTTFTLIITYLEF